MKLAYSGSSWNNIIFFLKIFNKISFGNLYLIAITAVLPQISIISCTINWPQPCSMKGLKKKWKMYNRHFDLRGCGMLNELFYSQRPIVTLHTCQRQSLRCSSNTQLIKTLEIDLFDAWAYLYILLGYSNINATHLNDMELSGYYSQKLNNNQRYDYIHTLHSTKTNLI